MKNFVISLLAIIPCIFYGQKADIITSDIDNFWVAYDKIRSVRDTTRQLQHIQTLYIDKGSPGLKAIMEVRGYTAREYVDAINNYPKFWKSVRKNTQQAKKLGSKLEAAIARLREIYPDLKPAPVYFTIGVMRTGGTYYNGMVLIGAEMALADEKTESSELPPAYAPGRRAYFDQNPIKDVVMLNIHEYVHTQQKEMVHNLLSKVIYEGVAEFVSAKALGMPSPTPAVHFGKKNPDVKARFEEEMFNFRLEYKWLYSDAQNEFNMRDLGYYVGYAFCEKYYNEAADKKAAIKKLIELDYTNEAEMETFIDSTKFFSAPIAELQRRYESSRPTVTGLKGVENYGKAVKAGPTIMTVTFSEPMDTAFRNFDYGPLGENHVIAIKNVSGFSADGRSITFEVDLEPEKHYQLTISNGFRNLRGVLLKPYLIDITTAK